MRRAVGLPDVPGIIVLRVGRDSAAAAAGLSRGDLVTDAGGVAVRSIGDLERAVQRAAGRLPVKVLRGADQHEFEVDLGAVTA
jgi:S1-C subfamily serine protease